MTICDPALDLLLDRLARCRKQAFQGEIQALLRVHAGEGVAFPECSVATSAGVKVADVAWASREFLRRHGSANPYPEAPEIVVEVLSDSKTRVEMEEKRALYVAQGAREYWICTDAGEMVFYDAGSERQASRLAPGFPSLVRLPFEEKALSETSVSTSPHESLEQLFAAIDGMPHQRLTKEEADRYLTEERGSWD